MEFKIKICYTYFHFMIAVFPDTNITIILITLADMLARMTLKKRNALYSHKHKDFFAKNWWSPLYCEDNQCVNCWDRWDQAKQSYFSSELEVDGYDLVRLDQSRRDGGAACFIKSSITYSFKDVFALKPKVFCWHLCTDQFYLASYINHLIHYISLNTLMTFSQKLRF